MANTNAQMEAEKWIRKEYLPKLYGQEFTKRNMILKTRGEFAFEAVSENGNIMAAISTSKAEASRGRTPTGKLNKIRADVLYFYLLPKMPEKALLVCTEQSMVDLINSEINNGRFPTEFEIIKVELPHELAEKVAESRREAAREAAPRKKEE
jgi:hypothetical protein